MSRREWILLIAIMAVGIGLRFVPHAPNFSPVLGLLIFAGAVFRDKKAAIAVPLAMLFISDLALGLYEGIAFVYMSYVLAGLLGTLIKRKKLFPTVAASLVASVIFFIFSNIGVWLFSGMYAKTFAGLVDCFVMAIPFFHTTAISTVVTAPVMMLVWNVAGRRVIERAPLNQ